MRAFIYVRVSDDRQAENTSLESQEKVCREWCAVRNIEVEQVFRDEGESAKTADRPQFQSMIEATERNHGHIGFVVIYKFNRFARNQHDQVTYGALLRARGVAVRSATEATDDTPFGRAAEGILAVFNQLDNEIRAENTVRGMKARANSGAWQWRAPLGYITAPTPGHLAIDPVRGPLVRQAFELIAAGNHSKAEVLRKLLASGLNMRPQEFQRLLRNPVYSGRVVVPRWGIDVEGAFEGLVSEELFNRVQAVLDRRAVPKVQHKRANENFPLRGLLRCNLCNKPITASMSTGKGGGKFGYYRCVHNHLNVPAAAVHERFLKLLDRLQPSMERMALVRQVFKRVWQERHNRSDTRVKTLMKQKTAIKEKRVKLLETRVSGHLALDDYAEFNARLNTELAAVESELHLAQSQEIDIDVALDWAERLLWNTRNLWVDSELAAKQKLQNVLFPHGLVLSKEAIWNTVSGSFYSFLGADEAEESALASHLNTNWNQFIAWINALRSVLPDAGRRIEWGGIQ